MARVYLKDECVAAINNAVKYLNIAKQELAQAEAKIESMLVAGEQPSDVEAYGTVRYKLAGLQLNQAITEIQNLNIDATNGLTFPSVVDLRSAQNAGGTANAQISYATVGNMDNSIDAAITDALGNRLTIIAKPKTRQGDIPNPFASIADGEKVRITKISADTTKSAVNGSLLGFEAVVATNADRALNADAAYPAVPADEGMTDIAWLTGYYYIRLDMNLKTVFDGTLSPTGAIDATEFGYLDPICTTIQMRQVSV